LNTRSRKGFTLVELMVVIGILGVLVGILAVAVIPRLLSAQSQLEIKQVGDIMSGLQNIQADQNRRRRLTQNAQVRETQGYKFFGAAFKVGLLEPDLVSRVVSLNSAGGDSQADRRFLTDDNVEFLPSNCSYTAPKALELARVMTASGENRKVVLSFNSRNWNNYVKDGVLVMWSDNQVAEYWKFEDIDQSVYSLDRNLWTNRPEDLIGKVAPFDATFE
jgi:prepilin-type N-terminal cleavage/methylation domain-containing protein